MISRLVDLKPTGLDTRIALSLAALDLEMSPQIAEIIGNAMPLPTGLGVMS
jgi:hypothetical protein